MTESQGAEGGALPALSRQANPAAARAIHYGWGAVSGSLVPSRLVPRIALVEARPVVRAGLTHWLRSVRRRCHVSCFSCVAEFLASAEAPEADAILLGTDASPAGESLMLDIVDELIGKLPGKPIMVLSDHNHALAWEAIRRGVRAYIPTTLDHSMTTAAFEVVMAGGYFVPVEMLIDSSRPPSGERPEVRLLRASASRPSDGPATQAPITTAAPSPPDKPTGVLTGRESEVLARIQEGKPNKVIAFELKIRESTVKVHVGHLMRKLNVSNRTQLAVRA